jgi:hypothetical protein
VLASFKLACASASDWQTQLLVRLLVPVQVAHSYGCPMQHQRLQSEGPESNAHYHPALSAILLMPPTTFCDRSPHVSPLCRACFAEARSTCLAARATCCRLGSPKSIRPRSQILPHPRRRVGHSRAMWSSTHGQHIGSPWGKPRHQHRPRCCNVLNTSC